MDGDESNLGAAAAPGAERATAARRRPCPFSASCGRFS